MGEIVVKPKGVMKIMSANGDDRIAWDPDDAKQVTKARTRFSELVAKGFRMFLMDPTGKKTGKQIDEFDPSAGAILAVPAMQGGAA
jgi:hypothetical protein